MTNKKVSLRAIMLSMAVSVGMTAFSQEVIEGQVRDDSGEPLVGVAIMNRQNKSGTTTDIDGRFKLKLQKGDKLSVSYLGYKPQIVTYKGKPLDVVMQQDTHSLDEMVVVGYGAQKRRDLIGAVDQVSGEVLENRSNPNIVRSLQGQIPGLNITMVDGKPIRTGSIHIRGNVNSIGAGGGALVLVDGVETDLNSVNPEDVQNVSVLKDASSAAIYGARGAFGVILITTKKAIPGKTRISYSGNFSWQRRTVKPQMVTNGLQWTKDFYEAYVNYKGKEPSTINNRFNKFIVSWDDWFSELERRDADPTLEKMRINADGYYDYFGNTDWYDVIYKNVSTATQHNISLSGGNKRATYLISGGFYQNNGIYNEGDERFRKFNLRAKGTIQINRWLKLSNNTDLWHRKYHEPAVMYPYSSGDMSTIIPIQRQIETQCFPVALVKNTDGTWTEAAVYSGWAGFCEGTSYRNLKKIIVRNTTDLDADILPDVLTAHADFTYSYTHNERDQVGNLYTGYIGPEITVKHQNYSYYEKRYYNTDYFAANATMTFTPRLGNDHHLKVMPIDVG